MQIPSKNRVQEESKVGMAKTFGWRAGLEEGCQLGPTGCFVLSILLDPSLALTSCLYVIISNFCEWW
jgi:hypothetical protein